ncbi:hypothetical protein AUQ37_06150 [Candidatus Methanomethylophilus sp. 1R26]|uniref:hypothetical protein n=1 Tax=Candidatus Methanomethylophilus sp. 1R26 TaxID=1769296 RepID=UPI00073C68D1|nr:hypothetical protein [Candidatus Methanomethylophilus sp. 1R26]KUE74122.1 hypothetical protein AUQ37_06150 [Candidatus Methanomethylophilus sp. 1R26]
MMKSLTDSSPVAEDEPQHRAHQRGRGEGHGDGDEGGNDPRSGKYGGGKTQDGEAERVGQPEGIDELTQGMAVPGNDERGDADQPEENDERREDPDDGRVERPLVPGLIYLALHVVLRRYGIHLGRSWRDMIKINRPENGFATAS